MRKIAIVLMGLISFSASVRAETVFEYGAGVVAVSLPAYPGSKDQDSYVLPLPYFYYKDDHIKVDREGLVGNLFQSNRWKLEASFSGAIPVNSDKSSVRTGMPDLGWTLEAGPRLLFYITEPEKRKGYLRAQLFGRKAFATDFSYLDQIGYRAGFGLESEQVISTWNDKTLFWSNRLTFNWANAEYLDYFYGVSDQYATSGRPAYRSHAGYAVTEFSSGIVVKFDHMMLAAFARYDNFSGSSATDSPLLQTNSNFTVGLGLIWIIGSNKS
ncbi:MipA/OmpV family protein [Shewanella yunxiaonensis]|uniref:MipA/OmpV family protein n=1 Tax=Shewanella yunxiaonensis TaxID=2829809 RepID=A0ABX7YWC9_9GAMM|nr:MipA/OmpV family protein [Shewanella yunxiaonensis]QUN06955.1 MipA/OmpV family protein [Shewanella yunxiaonensis]